MRRGTDWVAIQVHGGVSAPMRARRAAVEALGRLVAASTHVRDGVADIVSELVGAAVRRGGAVDPAHTIEIVLERRGGAVRVTVRDDDVACLVQDGSPPRSAVAHRCLSGSEPHGAWAELRL